MISIDTVALLPLLFIHTHKHHARGMRVPASVKELELA